MAGALTAMIAAAFAGGVTPDPYFEYTTLLLPGSGTNGAQNNTFLDGSTNNFTITRNGNTTQGTFSPFSQTGWGNYFSGSSALSTTSNPAFNFSNGSFTLECWFNKQGSGGSSDAVGNLLVYTGGGGFNATWLGITDSGTIIGKVGFSGSWAAEISGGSVSNGTWNHVALVRNSTGNTLTLYLNGSSIASTTNSTDLSTYGTSSSIAVNLGSTRYFNGYISNARIVKGVAVYTGTFTPPTSALAATQSAGTNISAITGTQTSLLTCQSNRFIDNATANSGSGFAITLTGSPSVQAFSPFNPTASWSAATNGGSGYFDGSGDYLSVADNDAFALGSNDWTIECWVYVSSLSSQGFVAQVASNGADASIGFVLGINASGYPYIASYINGAYTAATASTAIVTNQWNHIAGSRASGTMGVFLNGSRLASTAVSGSSVNSTATVTVGASNSGSSALTTGYISGARIVNGTAVYSGTTYTVPTAPLTAITNTSLLLNCTNAGIYDATSKNDLETVADAQISNTTAKWGSTSIKFDGTGDYLTNNNASNSLLAFGTGDFTIEGWFYSNNASSAVQKGMFQTSDTIGGLKTSYTTGVSMNHGSTGELSVNVGSTVYTTSGASITTGAWFYFAITRSSGNVNVYVNGVSRASGSGNTNNLTGTYISVGGYYNTSYLFDGYLQDFRITKGYARTITTPTAAFPTL